jgi:selenocysteine lyase/cysteine desulfurase
MDPIDMDLNKNITGLCDECERERGTASIDNIRDLVMGLDQKVPLIGGRERTYVNLDNSATTPPFKQVVDCLTRCFQWYSSVHRGSGFKSMLSTHVYEGCREVVADFVGADLSYHTIIFVQNATHALNKLAGRLRPPNGNTVICTLMEHHSNMLPWRKLGCKVEYVNVQPEDGELDLNDMENKIRANAGRLSLVTVTAASNVTGTITQFRRIARVAHEHGALVALDATQLIPHRPFRMGDPEDPERIDFIAFSAHKMYAPFGVGVLVGPRWLFEEGTPDMVGGGTIHAVTEDEVIWARVPERDEAGTPNVPGALALASSIRTLQSIGMDTVAEHERELTRRALAQLLNIDGITLYGGKDPALANDRLGVISLNIEGMGHGKVAAILANEWGIGVRNGCFCAQPYVRELLGISIDEMRSIVKKLAAGDHTTVPGTVRISLGVYNTADEVDYAIEALRSIARNGPKANYIIDEKYLDYVADPPFFHLDNYDPLCFMQFQEDDY